jgi:hypothetical protein
VILVNLGNNEGSQFNLNYIVTSEDEQELRGSIPNHEFRSVTPPGKGPYRVKMGYGSGGFSRSAKAEGVSAGSIVSFIDISSKHSGGPALPGTGYYAIVTDEAS